MGILLIYLLYPTLVFDTFQSSRKSWRKMAFLLSPSVLGLAAVAGLVIYLLFFSKPKLPPGTKKLPGPKGIPLLGSVPDLPAKHSWLQFYAWTKQYGPICQVKLGADTCVLVADPKIVEDLLVKRAAKYSGRVHFSAIWGDCATDGHYLPLMTSCRMCLTPERYHLTLDGLHTVCDCEADANKAG